MKRPILNSRQRAVVVAFCASLENGDDDPAEITRRVMFGNDNQPRDKDGKWTSGGSSKDGSKDSSNSKAENKKKRTPREKADGVSKALDKIDTPHGKLQFADMRRDGDSVIVEFAPTRKKRESSMGKAAWESEYERPILDSIEKAAADAGQGLDDFEVRVSSGGWVEAVFRAPYEG